MFTENFFTILLDLGDDWVVKSVESNIKTNEVFIHIKSISNEFEDPETGKKCKIYDHAPERKWRHLDTMQYKTYITCKLPRIKTPSGKIKTLQPNWASGYERHLSV